MWIFFALFFGTLAAALAANAWVIHKGHRWVRTLGQSAHAQTAIVLGAYVYGTHGKLSPVLQDRVDMGIALFKAGRVDTLLLSGDHGRADYDEVNAMRAYAEQHGVPNQKIFLDHAGFNTYDTMARARRVFLVESAIVVTNRFHLARAMFLAHSQGIQTQGVVADQRVYVDADYNEQREFAARCKAFLYVYLWRPDPTFLGPAIPITGDARASHDQTP